MNGKPLPVGVDNFSEIIEEGYFYVDKTLLIKELLDMKGEVNRFNRPRRFGKTLNMSMLRYFFEKGGDDHSHLFRGLKIMAAGDEYLAHMGKYPVVSISLKSMKLASYEQAFEMLKKIMAEEYLRHWADIGDSDRLTQPQKESFLRIRDMKGTFGDYLDALKFLTECLYQCAGEKAVVLIDEYDVPLENAWFSGFYDQMITVIRSLFESALKTNDHLAFAVVTGCLRISRESIFTGLNNLKINSITSTAFSEHYGFTQGEVDEMLKAYRLSEKRGEIRDWYNGYCFGTSQVYNPWSVINYVDACRADADGNAEKHEKLYCAF